VVGYLSSKSEAAEIGIVAGVKKGLAQFGFVDGSNVLMTYRWSGGNYDRLAEFVTELIRNNVDIIVTSGLPATLAAKAATRSIRSRSRSRTALIIPARISPASP
jgi:putative ABC transport system substrate-binding protein